MMVIVIRRWWSLTKRIFVFALLVSLPTIAMAVTETATKSRDIGSFFYDNLFVIIQSIGVIFFYSITLLGNIKEVKKDISNIKEETDDIRQKLEDLQGRETDSQIRLKEQEIDMRYTKELMQKLEDLIKRLDDDARNR